MDSTNIFDRALIVCILQHMQCLKPTMRNICTRVNVSLPKVLLEKSRQVLPELGFAGLSDYLQFRLRLDTGTCSVLRQNVHFKEDLHDVETSGT
jgi:hypothetical protein